MRGFVMHEAVTVFLTGERREVLNLGTNSTEPVDTRFPALHWAGLQGGPTGIFLQITCDDAVDLPIPGRKYTLSSSRF
jgi:hypothetical protein